MTNKININDLTLGQIKEIQALDFGLSTGGVSAPLPEVKGRYIVLGNRGNTVVGDLTVIGGTGILINASVIRRWGTSKGLGQLALEGKQPETVLDPCGEFEFEVLTTCGMIKVTSDL